MQLSKILITKQRGKSPYKKLLKNDIQCLQQSNIADNDRLEKFLKPMAEYLALRIID